jgi:hypothetical protein
MTSPELVMVIVEDQRQRQFLYRFLVSSGIHPSRIAIEQCLPGRGSAKQWVSNRFARSVEACRLRNSKAATSLFVMMDADHLSVSQCMEDLDAALAAAKQPKLDPTVDQIARLFPKWSVETWVIYLSSGGEINPPISEDRSLKDSKLPEQWNEIIPLAAENLCDWTRSKAQRPKNLPDSLQRGLDEIPRALPVRR